MDKSCELCNVISRNVQALVRTILSFSYLGGCTLCIYPIWCVEYWASWLHYNYSFHSVVNTILYSEITLSEAPSCKGLCMAGAHPATQCWTAFEHSAFIHGPMYVHRARPFWILNCVPSNPTLFCIFLLRAFVFVAFSVASIIQYHELSSERIQRSA